MRYFSKTDSTAPKSIAGKYLSGIFTILFSGLLSVGQVSAQPEIAIKGNGVMIVDGDNTPGPADYTDYGVTSAATGVVVRTFTIYNQGVGQLQLTGSPRVVIGGASTANFTVSVQPPAIVNPGDSATFSIAFNPDAIGEFTATVSISNNDANENPFNFTLKGAGEFDIRDCTDPCTGQDVTVESVKMNDEFGNPLPPNLCSSPGTTVVATTLSFTILNHTSASRQAIRVAADIFLDGIDSGDDVIFCFDGPIPGNDSAVVTIGPFAYTLGQTFELRNFKIAWRTANNADCSNSMVCNNYPGGQCSPIAALPDFTVTTPLAPSFSSILPPPCFPSLKGTFQSSITGGTPPYTYSWNFGDPASGTNNSSTLPQAEHEFSGAGNFTVSLTVTDSKGVSCTVAVPVSLTQPTVAAVSVNGMLTCLNPTLVLNGSGSSTGPNFTYQWFSSNGNPVNGGNTLQPTISQPGTYTLVVTNQDNGCTASTTITVSADQTLPYSSAGPPQVLTCLNSTVQLQGSGSNGTGFSIQWTANPGFIVSGANTFTPTVNQAGTYILVVTNTLNGCSSTASINVTSNTAVPSANAGPPLQLNCAHPTLQLQGSGSNGPGFTIQWTANPGFIINGANTYTPTVNQPGTYTLKVTDIASGCTNEATVTVTAVFYDPLVSIDPPEMITCLTSTVVINGSAISQGGSLVINWTTANGNIVSGGNTTNVTVDQPGIYTLTAVNDVGCTATASIQVIKNTTPPVVNAGPNAVLNCSVQQLALVGSGSTGPDFSYSWTTADGHIISGQNTLNPVIDSAGTYTLVVTNTLNDCTAESSVTITTDYTPPVANAGGDVSITCANLMTAQLNGSGSSTGTKYNYQWVANPGNIVSGANTLNDVVVNTAGSYTLIVTDVNNGCTDEDAVTVSEAIDYPVAYILPPQQLDCAVLTVQLDAAGSTQGSNLTYAWSTINGNIVSGDNTLSPVVNKAGTYQLLVTDTENSCTDTASVTVVQDIIPPVAVVESPAPLTCQNSQIQLNGSGSSAGYSFLYEWSTQNGNILNGSTTLTPLVDKAGTYMLTVSNVENNCTAQASVQVSELKIQPAANAGSAQDITCSVQQIALNGNGSSQGAQYQYVWNTPNGNIVSGVNTLNPLVDAPGTYYLNVINVQTGCTAVSSVTVGVDQTAPQVVVAPGGELNCNTSSLTLDGTGSSTGPAITYLWSGSGGVIQSGQNTLNPVVNAAGTYKLVVTNTINGCTAAASTVVTSDATVPLASAGLPDTLTCLVAQLLLDGTASSQGSDFTYLWTGPSVVSGSNTLNPLIDGPGLYELIVTNTSNGCTALSTVDIPANTDSPVADAGPDAVLNCINNTLVLDGSASSSGPLFTYQWLATSGGNIVSGGSTLSPLIDSPGTYSLTVTNTANGCTGTDVANISQNTVPPVANAGTPGTITCINTTVTLNGNGSTGPDFSVLWTTPDGSILSGANTYSPVVDAQGTYNLVVTNNVNGCSAMSSVAVIKDADVPIAIAQAPNELNCIVQQIQLNGAGSTAGPSIQYNWTTTSGNIASGANTLTPTVNAPGQYTLTVFDSSNNCKALFTVHVIQNLTPPLANAGAPAILSCSNPVLTLNGSGSSQGAQFSYQWTTTNGNILEGANTLSPKVNNSGFYTLVVTNNQNACTASSTVQILLDQNSPQAQAGPGMTLTCLTQSVTLNTSGTSIGPGFAYQWTVSAGGNIVSGANGPAPVVNAPGTYTLLVTNPLNGCTALDSVDITEDVLPPVAVITPPEKLNCQIVQTTINTTGSSSGAQFSYKWTTSNGNIVAGAYSPEPVVNMPGTYYVQITNNSNGCTISAGTIVNQDISLPSADAGQATGLDCANTSVSLNGTAGNAGSNPQITWGTADGNIVSGANTLNPVVDAPGLYVLTVSNTANHCSSSAQITVYQDTTPPIIVTAAPPELSCVVSVVTLNAVGSSAGSAFTSQWEAQNGGNILSGASTLAPSVNAAGLYLLTISNTINKCTATAAVEVEQDVAEPLAVAGDSVALTCSLPNAQLNGAGSSTGSQFVYNWSTLDGQILSGETTLQPVIGAPGIYTIQVTDLSNGCTNEASVQVSQDIVPPLAAAVAPEILTCSTQMVTLNGNGSSTGSMFNYQWTTANGQITGGGNSLSPTVGAAGDYTLVVTNSVNGCSQSIVVTVYESVDPPSVSPDNSGTITCMISHLTLNGNGVSGSGAGLSYSWTTTDGSIVSGADSPTPVVNAGGLYTLLVTDLYNGCTATAEVLVPTDLDTPFVSVVQPDILTCNILSVTIDASGSAQGNEYSYVWNGPGIMSGNNTLSLTVNQAGNYQLQIFNNENGCSSSSEVIVPQDIEAPVADAGEGFSLACSVTEGHLDASGSSAGPGFSYFWTTPDGNIITDPTSADPLVNAIGNYFLLVTNTANGCTATDYVQVIENTNYPNSLEIYVEPPGCKSKPGLVKIVEVHGGFGPYLYSIDGGNTFGTANQFEDIDPGQYQLVIQDAFGCEYEQTLTFTEPVQPVVTTVPEISLAFGDSTTLKVSFNLPLNQIDTIIWTPYETLTPTDLPYEMTAKPFSSILYTVEVISVDGCSDLASIRVKVDNPHIWAPNAFSPHREDGWNDKFLIFASPNTVKNIKTLQIFDRWGDMVFRNDNIQPNDENLGWNGSFREQPMNPAVFVWWAEIELFSGQQIIMYGDVTIVD